MERTIIITKAQYNHIKNRASRKCSYEDADFDLSDASGNNIDDAYQIGYDDGVTDMADEILKIIEGE